MSAIHLKAVTLGFTEKPLIDDLTADIQVGEFIGILGPNGAGKSTLLRAILGLLKPIRGEIQVFNQPCQRGNPLIGYVPQFRQNASMNQLTGRAYIYATVNGHRMGLPWISSEERINIEEIIHLVGIESFIDRPYQQLSGGERQRVALAEALLSQPKILLLDEPLSGLDPGQQEKMVSLIHHIQKKLQITVLFTAHEINPLLPVLNRILYLVHGKATMGTVSSVINSETLSWLYDAPIEVIQHNQYLFVIHKNLGTPVHEHDHSIC